MYKYRYHLYKCKPKRNFWSWESTITERKNSLEGLDSSFELEEERISKLESRLINIMQSKEQRGTKE